MTLDFGLLTLEAGASPLPHISLDAWPDIASSQEALRSPDAPMRKVMQRFENGVTIVLGDNWTGYSSRSVTQNR